MPTHAEKRVLPYKPEQMYDLVADIERYPEFLPWCLAARIRKRTRLQTRNRPPSSHVADPWWRQVSA